jgi:hypothetical protein
MLFQPNVAKDLVEKGWASLSGLLKHAG